MVSRTLGIILCAGVGSRTRALTARDSNMFPTAKPRFPILETPVMHHSVLELQRIGVTQIYANLYSNPDSVTSFYDHIASNAGIKFFPQIELHGTMGDALSMVEKIGLQDDDNVFVLCGDVLCNADLGRLLQIHQESGADLTEYFNQVPWSQVHKYGTVQLDGIPQKINRHDKEPDAHLMYLEKHALELR